MSMVRCPADEHFYDDEKYEDCPYCRRTVIGDTQIRGRDPEEKTRLLTSRRKDGPAVAGSDDAGEPKTRVIWGKSKPAAEEAETSSAEVAAPAVGWLVVVDGPGKGADFRLSPGMNRIGRGADQDVSLNFGDASVSSSDHATIIYDYRHNRFYIKHGSGKNLTYLNDDVVMESVDLEPYSRIRIGDTELIFVPFCGERFTWATD